MELRQMAGVCRIGTVHAAGGDHVDRRLLGLHGVDLNTRGLGTQQHVGLAMGMLLGMGGGARGVVLHVEGVAGRAARWSNGAFSAVKLYQLLSTCGPVSTV